MCPLCTGTAGNCLAAVQLIRANSRMLEKASVVPDWTIHRLNGAPIAIPAYIAIPFQVITLPEFSWPRSPIPQVSIPVTKKLSAIPCTIRDTTNKQRDSKGYAIDCGYNEMGEGGL